MTHFQFSLLGGGGPKYYGCEISNPLPHTHDVRRRGFKILWPRYIEPSSPIHLKGGNLENFGCEKFTYWFPWLRGGGSKYPPPPYTIRVGFRIWWLRDIDLLSVFIVRRRGFKILWP
jgi:hypothetical protein